MIKELLASESLQSIDKLLANIADSLGVGVDMLKENGMQYIMQYGEYAFWSGFVWSFIFVTLIMACVEALVLSILAEIDELDRKSFITITAIIITFDILIIFLLSLSYIMSPEIYAIKEVIKLIQ